MINLDAINRRLSEMDEDEFVRRAPADIDALVAEVERLETERDKLLMQRADACKRLHEVRRAVYVEPPPSAM